MWLAARRLERAAGQATRHVLSAGTSSGHVEPFARDARHPRRALTCAPDVEDRLGMDDDATVGHAKRPDGKAGAAAAADAATAARAGPPRLYRRAVGGAAAVAVGDNVIGDKNS